MVHEGLTVAERGGISQAECGLAWGAGYGTVEVWGGLGSVGDFEDDFAAGVAGLALLVCLGGVGEGHDV
jgi:hypothetical protein